MSRFDCPKCKSSLRCRMLPHVPREDGRMAFSCIHCKTALTYNREQPLLLGFFYRTKARALTTFLAGMVLFSYIKSVVGSSTAMAIIALFGAVFTGEYHFSRKPAYEIVEKNTPETFILAG